MCLFSRLSVGQGLCCSWLQHSLLPRAGPGPELAISEQQRLCWVPENWGEHYLCRASAEPHWALL